jgi:hypothetical protein
VPEELRATEPDVYPVDRFQVAHKKAPISTADPGVAGRYIRVLGKDDRALFSADIALLAFEQVLGARGAVLSDHH